MKVSNAMKKGMLAVLVMVMAVSMCGFKAQAKTSNITLYQGETVKYSYIGLGTLKSVKSSKKSIVDAKKKSGSAVLTAVKTGKAKVTSQGTRASWIHNVTVKKADFQVAASPISNDKLLVSLNNNTSGYFDTISVDVVFCDAMGTELVRRTAYMYRVLPKTTTMETVSVPSAYSYPTIDYSKTMVAVKDWSRSISMKYKKYTKVKFTDTVSGGNLIMSAKAPYSGKGSVYIAYEVQFFDANGALVDVSTYLSMLYKQQKSKTTSIYMPRNAASYKVTKRVYEKK